MTWLGDVSLSNRVDAADQGLLRRKSVVTGIGDAFGKAAANKCDLLPDVTP
jgi:hypothetical protein